MAQIALNRDTNDLFARRTLPALSVLYSFLRLFFAILVAIALLTLLLGGVWYASVNPASSAIGLALFLSIGLLVGYAGAMPVLHPRRTQPRCTPSDYGIENWEDVRFLATDGVELGAWFIPPVPDGNHATVVFVHGLGGNRGDLLNEAAMLVSRGFGALLLDLRNHGQSRGTITTLGYSEAEDVRGAFNYVLTRPEVNPDCIGLLGYSMGAASVLRAAASIPQVRSVIVESAYSSLRDNIVRGFIAKTGLPPFPFAPLMIWLGERLTGLRIDQIRPIDDLMRIAPRAILFVHGKKDHAVHVSNSVRLYTAAKEPRGLYLIDRGTHSGLAATEPVEFEKRIGGFLDWSLRGIERRQVPRPSAI